MLGRLQPGALFYWHGFAALPLYVYRGKVPGSDLMHKAFCLATMRERQVCEGPVGRPPWWIRLLSVPLLAMAETQPRYLMVLQRLWRWHRSRKGRGGVAW